MKKKKTMIITGGTKGIGAGISGVFYKAGYHVLISARNDNGLAKKLGNRAKFQKADVTEPEEHKNLVKTVLNWTGNLDVYINCVGISDWRPVNEIDKDFWLKMIDVNLSSTFWGCRAAANVLKNNGSIINVSSLASKRGSANNSAYCTAKFGVNGITQALAKELGPRNIRVNAVCPVYVKTPGLLKALNNKNSPAQGVEIEMFLKDFAFKNAALQRLPTAEEVGKVCLFLASEEASAITGQCINVDCGVLVS